MANPDQPARVLGVVDVTAVVVGAMIGVGIFFTPSRVAQIVENGTLALCAWVIAGTIALCGGLAFAELGGFHHGSGAQYAILRDAYGPLPAFVFVFCNTTAVEGGGLGIVAIVCAENLGVAAGAGALGGRWVVALAAALIVGLSAANIAGVHLGSRIQNVTALAKVMMLIALTALAARVSPAPAEAAAPSAGSPGALRGLMAALVPAYFACGGFQLPLWISGEVREPRRTLPRAIVTGVILVIAVYLLANWAYLRLLGVAGVAGSRALAADAVARAWPGMGQRAAAAAVALSAFGGLNVHLLSGPRLVYGMARDGRFFPAFGALHGRQGTPAAAIGLVGAMALVLLFAAGPGGINRLLNGVVFVDGFFLVLTGAALFVLRRKQPGADRPVRVPGYPVVPLVFVLGQLGVEVGAYLDPAVRGAALIGVAWIVAGAVLYGVRFRAKGR
jgi:APA family basic amino acid/polyamine antiporter